MAETIVARKIVGFENVPFFSGSEDVAVWMETFEMFQKVYRWTEEECVSILPLRLMGSAKSWYRSVAQTANWATLKGLLKAQFEVKRSNASMIGALARIRQNPSERVLEFQTRFLEVVNLLPDPLSDAAIVEFFVDGLLPYIKEKVTSLVAHPLVMNQVIEVAKRFCPSLHSAVNNTNSGDVRFANHVGRDEPSNEQLKNMIWDLRQEIRHRDHEFMANRVEKNFQSAPENRHYQGRDQGHQRRPFRPWVGFTGCHLCKGNDHIIADCPERKAFNEYVAKKKSSDSGNSPASA